MEEWKARFTRLRAERGLVDVSVPDLHYVARRRLEDRGLRACSQSLMEKKLSPKGKGQPAIPFLETLAAAIDVDPEEFPEYRLAVARRALDESEVGLVQALENLRAYQAATAPRVEQRGAPPIPGETGRRVEARSPSGEGPAQPDSARDTGDAADGRR